MVGENTVSNPPNLLPYLRAANSHTEIAQSHGSLRRLFFGIAPIANEMPKVAWSERPRSSQSSARQAAGQPRVGASRIPDASPPPLSASAPFDGIRLLPHGGGGQPQPLGRLAEQAPRDSGQSTLERRGGLPKERGVVRRDVRHIRQAPAGQPRFKICRDSSQVDLQMSSVLQTRCMNSRIYRVYSVMHVCCCFTNTPRVENPHD